MKVSYLFCSMKDGPCPYIMKNGERIAVGGEACKLCANLTIEDPCLTEPYDHVIYKGLMNEMGKENFHNTIAFIPWNYERNEDEVAAHFLDYPDSFLICIHDNNHDHREF